LDSLATNRPRRAYSLIVPHRLHWVP
jgi:hypothetical protein